MKTCFKCGEVKALSDFYKHKMMADGHLGKCKECTKRDVKVNRTENIERFRAYDRERGNRHGPEYVEEYRKRYPNKHKAHALVSYHVKAGNLIPMPCEICGAKGVAHHDDYLKPLNVRWLCYAHHSQWHAKHGEGANAS